MTSLRVGSLKVPTDESVLNKYIQLNHCLPRSSSIAFMLVCLYKKGKYDYGILEQKLLGELSNDSSWKLRSFRMVSPEYPPGKTL